VPFQYLGLSVNSPEEAYEWSGGKAIYATGVQFPPVHYDGNTFLPGQANNFYVYPAVGLAIYATRAKFVTDGMCIEAARATANQASLGSSVIVVQGCLLYY
jgi:malate dehydrogenase (oxaloacetate-decarboxylating)(NADP+)